MSTVYFKHVGGGEGGKLDYVLYLLEDIKNPQKCIKARVKQKFDTKYFSL